MGASSNAIFSYSGLEIEFEHGRPAGGSPRAILFIVHSMCPKCLLIAPFHNYPRFSNMPSGWATASTTSLLYISGQDFERAREGKKPTNYLNESLNIKSPLRKIATLHQTWCGTLLRFEPINLYVETFT